VVNASLFLHSFFDVFAFSRYFSHLSIHIPSLDFFLALRIKTSVLFIDNFAGWGLQKPNDTMAKGRLSNMRWPKPLHLFFILLGASMSLILFTRILSPKTSYVHSLTDWVPSAAEITNGISDSIGKSSIKTRMEHSESLWSKTVAQRRKIIEEYGNVGL
jgi:hypothetical protein